MKLSNALQRDYAECEIMGENTEESKNVQFICIATRWQ
jgi:hypothetical protein